jgi:hypothetical protein
VETTSPHSEHYSVRITDPFRCGHSSLSGHRRRAESSCRPVVKESNPTGLPAAAKHTRTLEPSEIGTMEHAKIFEERSPLVTIILYKVDFRKSQPAISTQPCGLSNSCDCGEGGSTSM